MNVVLLGPQGSGKGTQAELLVERFGMNYVEMGRILRSIAASDNPHASQILESMNNGNLVPDEFVRLIAWDHIQKADKNRGFLFDGYPRSLPQYEHLQDMLRKYGQRFDWVIFLGISTEESVTRLCARRVCKKCGEIYNVVSHSTRVEGKCDKCQGALVHREDDKPEAIRRRLELYRERTEPILYRAKHEKIAMEVNGERSIETIHQEIVKRIQGGK